MSKTKQNKTGRGNARGINRIPGLQYLTPANLGYALEVLSPERIREANMSTFDAFASPQCRPFDLMNAGRKSVWTKAENILLCRAQKNKAAGYALTADEQNALDAYYGTAELTARKNRAADYLEKKIRQASWKAQDRKMMFEDVAAGIFAALGIVFMLSLAYGLLSGQL